MSSRTFIAGLLCAGWLAVSAAPAPALGAPSTANPAALPAAAVPAAPAAEHPKTVILGFDGMDFALTTQFMDEGLLPNFQRLAEQGLFQPLETSNPAQSPVSWAVFNTGTNPGKTGVAGFVSRKINPPAGTSKGSVGPQPMLGFNTTVDAAPFVRFPMALENRVAFLAIASVGALVVGLLLFRLLLGIPTLFAVILALGAGGLGGWMADGYVKSLPADGKVPYVINPMQGTNFWSYLDSEGVRLRGIQVASTYPPDNEGPNTQLLAGLGVPDVGGSPGTFYVYTNDPWAFEKGTGAGGEIVKIYEDDPDARPGFFEGELVGPRNWIRRADFDHRIDTLESRKDDPELSTHERDRVEEEINRIRSERKAWSSKEKVVTPFGMNADRSGGAVSFDVAGHKETVDRGGWSSFIPVAFELTDSYSAYGIVRFHVMECDDDEVRIFVPPISIDPERPPAHLPISSPPEFSGELARAIGHPFETLGWACMTNPLKDIEDTEFTAESFLQDIGINLDWRLEILDASFDDASAWDVYYQVDGGTDRTAHMLYREFDPEHPLYDEEYANTEVNAFGRTFPLKRAIPEVYKEADRYVGHVLDRIEGGDLGEGALLLVVSDHGFQSFRRGVNLNNVLHDLGYLHIKDGMSVDEAFDAGRSKLLMYVDWERTQAYSLGLGKVFINLQGREPQGLVSPDEYDVLIEKLRGELLQLTDGDGGPQVVTSALRRDELYDGPWWKEGEAKRLVAGREESVHHDGFADLFLGYRPYYRVSWGNTMGDLNRAAIVDNDKHWSGDHVSVDPVHVQGILFSNRKLAQPATSGLIDIGPTVVRRYGIDLGRTDMDGRPLVFQGDE